MKHLNIIIPFVDSLLSEYVIFLPKHVVVGKGKGHPITCPEGPEREWRYSCTLSLPSALYGVDGQRHAPVAVTPGKSRYPLYRRLGGHQGRSGECGFDPRIVQPIASRYSDWAIQGHQVAVVSVLFKYIWCVHLVGSINEYSLLKVQNFTAVSLTQAVHYRTGSFTHPVTAGVRMRTVNRSNLYS